SIMRDVARALAYAHERGVVHRDIKPDNVLLSGGVAVVTDFGIAKAISDATTAPARVSLTATGVSVGTPAYMAPEQAAADPATDHRADIYSFGCMAYELLTGQPPFADVPSSKRLAAQITRAPAPVSSFRPDVPQALETLVMRCLEKEPADRPQRADELTRALDTIVARRTAQMAIPTTLLVPVVLGKVLMLYVAAMLAVLLLLRGAVVWLRVPAPILPGAIVVMSLGLPFVLRTSWLHYRDRRAASEAPVPTSHG
ncbi:MAG TPA: serine/threonine-protein kinase, partial [Gemmatimonadaceae bacterium]|nr:serine/threonine-protein kinase [Gemmatimonadaceae bacterium]